MSKERLIAAIDDDGPFRAGLVELLSSTIYGFGGNVIRGDGGSDERFIGAQGEVVLTYEYNRNLNALLSYSRFHPGAFIEDTGPSKMVDFFGAEINLQF